MPNWLDTAGHQRGTVGVRWVGPDVVDVLPTTRVVKLDSLLSGGGSTFHPTPSSSSTWRSTKPLPGEQLSQRRAAIPKTGTGRLRPADHSRRSAVARLTSARS